MSLLVSCSCSSWFPLMRLTSVSLLVSCSCSSWFPFPYSCVWTLANSSSCSFLSLLHFAYCSLRVNITMRENLAKLCHDVNNNLNHPLKNCYRGEQKILTPTGSPCCAWFYAMKIFHKNYKGYGMTVNFYIKNFIHILLFNLSAFHFPLPRP